MARKKPSNLYPVKDLAAANTALAEIANIKRALSHIESSMNSDIDLIKSTSKVQAEPLKNRLKEIENGLLAFAEFRKDDLFAERRSQVLDFGIIGYRKSKELKPKKKMTWKMVLGRLKELNFSVAIRTKDSVDKDELHTWPDERLELVGARRVEKDTFWYEIEEKELADTAA